MSTINGGGNVLKFVGPRNIAIIGSSSQIWIYLDGSFVGKFNFTSVTSAGISQPRLRPNGWGTVDVQGGFVTFTGRMSCFDTSSLGH